MAEQYTQAPVSNRAKFPHVGHFGPMPSGSGVLDSAALPGFVDPVVRLPYRVRSRVLVGIGSVMPIAFQAPRQQHVRTESAKDDCRRDGLNQKTGRGESPVLKQLNPRAGSDVSPTQAPK